MTDPELSFQQFEMDYENALAMLAERHGDFRRGGRANPLPQERGPNSSADQYAHDWIQPFVAVVTNLAQYNLVRQPCELGEDWVRWFRRPSLQRWFKRCS